MGKFDIINSKSDLLVQKMKGFYNVQSAINTLDEIAQRAFKNEKKSNKSSSKKKENVEKGAWNSLIHQIQDQLKQLNLDMASQVPFSSKQYQEIRSNLDKLKVYIDEIQKNVKKEDKKHLEGYYKVIDSELNAIFVNYKKASSYQKKIEKGEQDFDKWKQNINEMLDIVYVQLAKAPTDAEKKALMNQQNELFKDHAKYCEKYGVNILPAMMAEKFHGEQLVSIRQAFVPGIGSRGGVCTGASLKISEHLHHNAGLTKEEILRKKTQIFNLTDIKTQNENIPRGLNYDATVHEYQENTIVPVSFESSRKEVSNISAPKTQKMLKEWEAQKAKHFESDNRFLIITDKKTKNTYIYGMTQSTGQYELRNIADMDFSPRTLEMIAQGKPLGKSLNNTIARKFGYGIGHQRFKRNLGERKAGKMAVNVSLTIANTRQEKPHVFSKEIMDRLFSREPKPGESYQIYIRGNQAHTLAVSIRPDGIIFTDVNFGAFFFENEKDFRQFFSGLMLWTYSSFNQSFEIGYLTEDSPKFDEAQRKLLARADSMRSSQTDIRRLSQEGVNINIRNQTGESPLVLAAKNLAVDNVKELFRNGQVLDVNHPADNNIILTAIKKYLEVRNQAASSSFTPHLQLMELIQILAEHGANLNYKDTKGNTPLMLLLKRCPEQTQVINALLEAGADPNIPDNDGKLPLQILQDNSKLQSQQKQTLIDLLVINSASDRPEIRSSKSKVITFSSKTDDSLTDSLSDSDSLSMEEKKSSKKSSRKTASPLYDQKTQKSPRGENKDVSPKREKKRKSSPKGDKKRKAETKSTASTSSKQSSPKRRSSKK